MVAEGGGALEPGDGLVAITELRVDVGDADGGPVVAHCVGLERPAQSLGRCAVAARGAPSPDACRRHAAIAGLPLDDVIPLGADMGPGK